MKKCLNGPINKIEMNKEKICTVCSGSTKICSWFILHLKNLKFFFVYIVLLILTVLFFLHYPEKDLLFSSLFFDEELKQFFFASREYSGIIKSEFLFITSVLLIVLLYFTFRVYKSPTEASIVQVIYLNSVFFLAWLLMSHYVIKKIFRRSRPIYIERFYGEFPYEKVFSIGNYCISDCSFISGHASLGFMVYAFIFLSKKSTNKITFFILGTVLGFSFGIIRIAEGKHFLSDVVFAGFFMLFFCYILYKISYIIGQIFLLRSKND